MLYQHEKRQYLNLRSCILSLECENAQIFENLKLLYKEEIRSNRTYDRIKNLPELITVLEKRDFLNEENFLKLKNIADVLNITPPQHIINRKSYSSIASSTISNLSFPINSHISQPLVYTNITSRIQCEPHIKVEVYQRISSEIGRHWKEFGRLLDVSESAIDDLATKDSSDRVHAILHFHEINCDPRKWKTKLLKALVGCRRRDLCERVELIFDTH